MKFKRQIYLSFVLSSLLLAETNSTANSPGGGHLKNSVLSTSASNSNASSISAQKSLDTNSSNEPYRLDATVITANTFPFQSGEEINERQLTTTPNGNGDITSLLKMTPNVQFDTRAMSSNTPGEITPPNISISGGLYYQNSFLLDGKSINNDLSGVSEGSDPGNVRDSTMGRSQGLNIDTFLLKSVKVQDSNVGASYGGFTGGVVEAETRSAEKDFGANFAYQISQGNANDGAFSLTKYHIYETATFKKEDFLNSGNTDYQPKFIKHSFRSSLESKINDKLGVIASFTTTQSFIPLKVSSELDSEFAREERTQKRESYNFFIKTNYQASDDVALEASYAYMPQLGVYYRDYAINSQTTMKNGGHQLGLDGTINNSLGFASITSFFSYMEESRRSESSILQNWIYSPEKSWGDGFTSAYGSFGDEDNKQQDLSLKLTQNFEPYYDDTWETGFNIGTEFSYTYAYFKRLKDSWQGGQAILLDNVSTGFDNSNYTCQAGDIWCSNSKPDENKWGSNNGQFFSTIEEYKAGEIDMDNFQTAFFIENESRFDLGNKGDVATRLGLRMDYDTYMQKAPIAPRFSTNYTAPWGKEDFKYNTQFTFGANRYYGRNMYAYKLSQGKSALESFYMRSDASKTLESLPWGDDPNGDMNYHYSHANSFDFRQLKIPYADELMFGVIQEVGLFNVSSKYIHRFGRDEVRYKCGKRDSSSTCLYYTYDNSDESDTDVITLTIGNNTPFMSGSMLNYFNFAFDYTDVKRSYNNYKDEKISPSQDSWIKYNGTVQRRSELSVTNFAQPLSFRFSTTHTIKLLNTDWTLNNFFRVRMPYNATTESPDNPSPCGATQATACVYEDYRIPTRFTWDLRLGIEKEVYKKNTLYANIDVFNVLDKVNLNVKQNTKNLSRSSSLSYETGRQFWLEVGYRY